MQEKTIVKISTLKLWDENPRSITTESFERLKNHIKKFDQYKPIIVTKENIVVGGNMRVRAMRELGIEDVWVSYVDAPTRSKILEYAMSDNESFGDWEEEQLAELLSQEWTNLDVKDFQIDTGKESLEDLLNKFGPGDEPEAEDADDTTKEDLVECPKCHHKFTP